MLTYEDYQAITVPLKRNLELLDREPQIRFNDSYMGDEIVFTEE